MNGSGRLLGVCFPRGSEVCRDSSFCLRVQASFKPLAFTLSPTALGGLDVTDPDPGSSRLGSVHLPVRQTQEFLGFDPGIVGDAYAYRG